MTDDFDLDARLERLHDHPVPVPSVDLVIGEHRRRRRRSRTIAALAVVGLLVAGAGVAAGLGRGGGGVPVESDLAAPTTTEQGANRWTDPFASMTDVSMQRPPEGTPCPTVPAPASEEGIDARSALDEDAGGYTYARLTLTNTTDEPVTVVGSPEGLLLGPDGDPITYEFPSTSIDDAVLAPGATSDEYRVDIGIPTCRDVDIPPDAVPVGIVELRLADGTTVRRSVPLG